MKFDFDQAASRHDSLQALRERWKVEPQFEIVLLADAFNRVTSKDVYAILSFPVVRSSKRDGIAVKASRFLAGLPDASGWIAGQDYVQADTGDDFSDDFDAVIAVEDIELLPQGGLRFIDENLQVEPGSGINRKGSTVEAGSLIVRAHTRLTPEAVAACAMAGVVQIEVLKLVCVAYIPTGNELVTWGSYPQRGQTLETNSLLIRGMLSEWGSDISFYPIIEDNRQSLENALDRALEIADIVLINGGSSRGKEEFNSEMLKQRATFFRHGVRAVPGRPIGMAIIDNKMVINVPGPAQATFLAMDWLVSGLVAHFYGIPAPQPQSLEARLTEDIGKPDRFERIVRVKLSRDVDGAMSCAPIPAGIGTPQLLTSTDAQLVLPIGCSKAEAGSFWQVELLRPLELIEQSWLD